MKNNVYVYVVQFNGENINEIRWILKEANLDYSVTGGNGLAVIDDKNGGKVIIEEGNILAIDILGQIYVCTNKQFYDLIRRCE